MRNYQRIKNNPYKLPHNIYMQVLYTIRDYDRLREERKDILLSVPDSASPEGDPTANRALQLAKVNERLEAIDRAIREIPEEYRRGVWNNIAHAAPYPCTADSSTWGRWRQRFFFYTAKFLYVA